LLELHKQNRSLLFSQDPLERVNACLSEMESKNLSQKVFVLEKGTEEKRKESYNSIALIVGIVLLLFFAKFVR